MSTEKVRTDFILANTFIHLRRSVHPIKLSSIPALDEKEERVLKRVFKFCNIIHYFHFAKIYYLVCSFFRVEQNKLEELLYGLYDQLFSNGITWSRILLFIDIIVFFAITHSPNDLLYKYFSIIVKEKLQPWIDEHNGWEAIVLDEEMEVFPHVNLDDIILRRSKRLSRKKRIDHLEQNHQ